MFNECFIHLFDCTWLNVLYVCLTTCLIKLKRFLIILYVFGSDFYHSLCSCLVRTLFFIVLNMFSVEKQVSEFFTTHLRVAKLEKSIFFAFFGSLAKRFATHSQVSTQVTKKTMKISWKLFSGLITQLAPSRNTQKQLFKGLFMGNLF